MSWDQQAYSFGNPNAQPPTPTQTPTSGQFPSPTAFETPRNNSSFENRSGWTPTFAEEYSVFHSTPGRLTGDHSFLDTATPRPATSATQSRPLSGEIEADIASHALHLSPNPDTSLSAVGGSNQPPPSPTAFPNSRFDDSAKKVTPRKPRKRLEEAFSGQTATPPQSASKGTRKLAPKLQTGNMQHDPQDSHYGNSETPIDNVDFATFPSTSADIFSYPMSAPATANVFSNTKPFWDTDASMGDMDLDFTAEDAAMFATGSHRISSSFDWGRNNQIFQENMNMPQPPPPAEEVNTTTTKQPVKRQRPLAPKVTTAGTTDLPKSMPPFDFNTSNTTVTGAPFSVAALGGSVDPGLLFSQSNSTAVSNDFEDVTLPEPRPATSHVTLQPYQHQQREFRRDQEELRRSRSTRERSSGRSFDRQTVSSPVKGSARPGLHRTASDRVKRTQGGRILPRTGRSSPVKQKRAGNLPSIQESPNPKPRTEVIFTIDAKGKARTETITIGEEPSPTKRGHPSSTNGDWDSSPYESSSDEEPIILPSRNSSFSIPPQPKAQKLTRFDMSHQNELRSKSASASGHSHSESSSQRSIQLDSVESEAETVMEEDDGSGDATRELRKVMENRKKNQLKQRNPQHHRYGTDARSGSMYYNSISPNTVTDPDGATPSSTRSGPTRCVCHNNDSEGFMIQCESCDNWLHTQCVNIDRRSLPPVYICAFCAQTPKLRGVRAREPARVTHLASSPLAHKSFKSFR